MQSLRKFCKKKSSEQSQRDKIKKIFRCSIAYFEKWDSEWNTDPTELKIMLHSIPLKNFECRMNDDDLTRRILDCVTSFKMGSHLEFVLYGLGGYQDKGSVRHYSMHYFIFYILFAREHGLLFNSHRLTDLCVDKDFRYNFSNNFLSCSPKKVLTLFQFGARIFDSGTPNSSGMKNMFMSIMLCFILKGFRAKAWDHRMDPDLQNSDLVLDVDNMVNIIGTCLKVVQAPQHGALVIAIALVKKGCVLNIDTIVNFYDNLFPGCNLGRNSPSSLKHLCRYMIREVLIENWALPGATFHLPIPSLLQQYLDLEI